MTRYALPSAGMAIVVLASLAVNDWCLGLLRRSAVIAGSLTAVAITASAWSMGSELISSLHTAAGRIYSTWLYGSLSFACFTVAGLVTILWKPPTRLRRRLLLSLAAGEALLLFAIPLFSGLRQTEIDTRPVAFLKSHLGLNRFFSLGPMSPNYSAFFAIPAINHISLPVDSAWVGYLRTQLDPALDATTFSGTWPPPLIARYEEVRRHVHALESLGVKYVVTPANSNPFVRKWSPSHVPTGNIPLNLEENQKIDGDLPISAANRGTVSELGILLGTYGGTATGDISVQLCQETKCVEGAGSLKGATDNQSFTIPLRNPLQVSSAAGLRYSIRYANGKHPVAIWVWPTQGTEPPLKSSFRDDLPYKPELTLGFETDSSGPQVVFHDRLADVYELRKPEPYFSLLSGKCEIQALSRDSARLSCSTDARLLRRELFYPGWHSIIDGGLKQAVKQEGIFQAISIPAGSHTVSFVYSPVNWTYALAIALFGSVLLIAIMLRVPNSWQFANRVRQ